MVAMRRFFCGLAFSAACLSGTGLASAAKAPDSSAGPSPTTVLTRVGDQNSQIDQGDQGNVNEGDQDHIDEGDITQDDQRDQENGDQQDVKQDDQRNQSGQDN